MSVRVALALVAALSLVAVGCAAQSAASSAVSLPPVVRAVLASGRPTVAADDNLELVRYTIQPGTTLPAHRHPGMQIALIESGVLTYTVIEGSVTVHQADGGTRTIGPGQTGTLTAGEWIVEDETIAHFGKNAGSVPVVILASSLLAADQPPAVVLSPAPS